MNRVLEEFSRIGIVPVIALECAADAGPLAKALMEGGLACAEITFRTDAAEEAIRIMADQFPEMLVGAGTVLSTEQAKRAMDAGARFIVSPGFNEKVVKYCLEQNIPVVPGCANPSDIERAIELGLSVVKFFPAEACGGLPAIKAISAPYHKMKFMPTGGINPANINSYLAFDKVIACGGSVMVSPQMMREKNWDGIRALTREAVDAMLGFTLRHIGINCETEAVAREEGKKFASLFGTDVNERGGALFAGPFVEMVKQNGRGTHGHIAVGVHSVERGVYHLQRRGFQFDEKSRTLDAKGNLKSIYFSEEIAGFAVHLVQN